MRLVQVTGKGLIRVWKGLMDGGLRIWFLVMGIRLWGRGRGFLRKFWNGICKGRNECKWKRGGGLGGNLASMFESKGELFLWVDAV